MVVDRREYVALTEEQLDDLLWAMGAAFPWTLESKRPLLDTLEAVKKRFAEPRTPLPTPRRRLRVCVEAWPECREGEYNPNCCRFPKSCSCDVYDDGRIAEADLEPADG